MNKPNAWIASLALTTVLAGACSLATAVSSQQQAVAISTLDSLKAQFQFPMRAPTDGTSGSVPARSVIPDAAASSVAIDSSGNLAPVGKIAARIALAATADSPTTLATADGGMSVGFKLHGAKAISVVTTGGYAVYTRADSHGGHYVQSVVHDLRHPLGYACSPHRIPKSSEKTAC